MGLGGGGYFNTIILNTKKTQLNGENNNYKLPCLVSFYCFPLVRILVYPSPQSPLSRVSYVIN